MNTKITDNQRSFTTEIEWFSTETKMPEEGRQIIFFESSDYFYIGSFTDYSAINSPSVFCHAEGSYEINKIKYWAYLPEIPHA